MEAPFDNPTLIQDSLHDTVGGYTTGQVTVPNYATNYNTYGVNWNAQTITYYVNGRVVGSTPTPASANTPAYILANLAVGGQGSWPGTPTSSNTWPANMNIQSITYNPNGPGGVGSDGGTYTGGLASAPSTTTPATTATVVTPTAATPTAVTAATPAAAATPATTLTALAAAIEQTPTTMAPPAPTPEPATTSSMAMADPTTTTSATMGMPSTSTQSTNTVLAHS